MQQVVIYGLGDYFNRNKDYIAANYDVVAYCDKNTDKGFTIENFMTIDDLSRYSQVNPVTVLLTLEREDLLFCVYDDLLSRLNPITRFECLKYSVMQKHYERYKYFTYSERNADFILSTIIKDHIKIPDSQVKYLELGVWSPIINSNTYTFYIRGGRHSCGCKYIGYTLDTKLSTAR